MDFLAFLIDLVLHIDKHLAVFVAQHGLWVYALLFAIIFVETGVVVMPFLPGDSLLFVVGTLCGTGAMDIGTSLAVMFGAAVAGNQSNYAIGRHFGPKVFQWESSRWFNKSAFLKAHDFFERYGGVTLVIGRFMPFLRTFAPFVAGVTAMTRRRFTFFDITGGALWVGSVTLTGYWFGGRPWVQANLEKIFWAMILIPGLVIVAGALRTRLRGSGSTPRP
ncbi:MAG: VTT domain-containing protein [Burkholderiaceae bacterium]